jgi:hypothetical protein
MAALAEMLVVSAVVGLRLRSAVSAHPVLATTAKVS